MEMEQKHNVVQYHCVSDLSVMLGQALRHIFHSMDTIITATITPIGLLL
nr:hypothetical protein [Thermogemmatispora tikiterensis]